ncbi:MAG TPA: S9 family peptidase, partial [Gemmatimonadales bacterium]|nr:S9 family peptidase [Gemmatimonadales bacterium]
MALALAAWVVPVAHAQVRWTPELALKVKNVGAVAVSPDAQRVAFTVGVAVMEGDKSEWLTHVHVARADGSASFQLTHGDKSATQPAWSPDGRWMAFLSSRSGTSNVWRIRVDGGEAEPLTEEKGNVSAFQWSPDGRMMAFLMPDPKTAEEEKADREKRDARVVDQDAKLTRLYVIPLQPDSAGQRVARRLTAEPRNVGGAFGGGELSWAPDGSAIAFSHTASPVADSWTSADIAVVDLKSGAVRSLAATAASETDPMFSPDGKWIAFTASDDPPTWAFTSRVHLVAAEGGSPRALAETFDRQPDLVGWSADGQRLYVSETRRTVNHLAAVPVDGQAPVDVSLPDVMVTAPTINRSGTHLGFVTQGTDRPPEVALSPLRAFRPVQVSTVQDLPAAPVGRTEVLRWRAPDGREIEGLLTYPVNYQAGARVPLLVIVHGGPTGVFTQSFIARAGAYPIATFSADGYAVLRCNVRGSSGYGREFRYANYGDWGGGDYQDIMAGVDAVIQSGVADPDRLGVMGWSYGGFMTSWIITQTRRFKAASVGAGVTNLMSFTGTADIPGFIPDYFGGEFWDGLDAWRSHSAMFNIKGVSTPTLIQHGERDLRVPISQGYELYNALKRQGVPARMVVYPRQPHGIQEPQLQLDAMKRNVEWFEQWVLGRRVSR